MKRDKRLAVRILSRLGIVVACFAAFVVLYFGVAWGCSRIAIPAEKSDAPREVAIFITTNGAHTDIVMPVRNQTIDWSLELKYSNNRSQDTLYRYVAIGWGDKGFFLEMPTWDDLTFPLAFRAAFWLSTTAMHVTYYNDVTEGLACRRILITQEQYARLAAFVTDRFRTDPEGHFISITTDANYGPTDAFYEAHGRYNLFYSCNSWANDALRACGQRCCLWALFDKGIFLKYPLPGTE